MDLDNSVDLKDKRLINDPGKKSHGALINIVIFFYLAVLAWSSTIKVVNSSQVLTRSFQVLVLPMYLYW